MGAHWNGYFNKISISQGLRQISQFQKQKFHKSIDKRGIQSHNQRYLFPDVRCRLKEILITLQLQSA